MLILEGKDVMAHKSIGDFCNFHKLGYMGPECPVCEKESEVEMVAQSALADKLDERRIVK